MSTAPTLQVGDLTLRMPVLADFEHRAAFYASERSTFESGPMDRPAAWRVWASEVGQWPLMGFGPFSVERAGRYVGEVGVYQPDGYPEPELGWFVVPEAEGRGVAHTAALAVRDWARGVLGLARLVNYIDSRNARSIRLAERLGAVRDDAAPRPEPGDLVYRHPA